MHANSAPFFAFANQYVQLSCSCGYEVGVDGKTMSLVRFYWKFSAANALIFLTDYLSAKLNRRKIETLDHSPNDDDSRLPNISLKHRINSDCDFATFQVFLGRMTIMLFCFACTASIWRRAFNLCPPDDFKRFYLAEFKQLRLILKHFLRFYSDNRKLIADSRIWSKWINASLPNGWAEVRRNPKKCSPQTH